MKYFQFCPINGDFESMSIEDIYQAVRSQLKEEKIADLYMTSGGELKISYLEVGQLKSGPDKLLFGVDVKEEIHRLGSGF